MRHLPVKALSINSSQEYACLFQQLDRVLFCADGRAWSWGFGMFGALGHGDYVNQYEPTVIQGPWGKDEDKVVAVAAGGAHSAAVTGELPCFEA
jgi:alpha-tubulin suppressor-like RCC1 family protein